MTPNFEVTRLVNPTLNNLGKLVGATFLTESQADLRAVMLLPIATAFGGAVTHSKG